MRRPFLFSTVVALVAASPAARADSLPLSLTMRVTGSTLELAIKNAVNRPITIPINSAGFDDHLVVTLIRKGAAPRELRFTEPMDKFIQRTVELAPGATYTEAIDLVTATVHANADPPQPGDYTVDAVWSPEKPANLKAALYASAAMTIPAPVEGSCDAVAASTGIDLLARAVDARGTIEIGLHDSSSHPICVVSRIDAAGDNQSDSLTIQLDDGMGKALARVAFTAPRRKSKPVTVQLAPGATTWTRWDLAAWAKRTGVGLPHGLVFGEAHYDQLAESFALRLP